MIIEKPTREREIDDAYLKEMIARKISIAEQHVKEGDFQAAAREYKEAATVSFEIGDIELAMQLLDRQEAMTKLHAADGSRVSVYLVDLEKKVDHAMSLSRYGQARDLLKQMLAIAEQGRDVPAIKAIKQRLAKVQAMVLR